MTGDFPGCTVTRAQCFHFKGHKFSPGQGAKILHYIWYGLKKKKKKSTSAKCFKLANT